MGNVLFTIAVLCLLLYQGRLFLITLLLAIFFAFILDPVVGLFMRLRLRRDVASFLVCSLALTIVYLALLLAWQQAQGLWEDLPNYSKRVGEISERVAGRIESAEKQLNDFLTPRRLREIEANRRAQEELLRQQKQQRRQAQQLPGALPGTVGSVPEVRIYDDRSPIVEYFYSNWKQFYEVGLMASFVPFLVYFMLSWRDHFLHNFLRVFRGEARGIAAATMDGIARIARAYVVGNFLLGLLLALLSTGFFWAVKVPYWIIVGPISGFLSIVPYIGLPLALAPPFLAALTVYDNITAYLIIGSAVAFFHLIALNLLYPKLVGRRVHLNPLVVTVALMFWGFLWGGAGLLLAIPITAATKAVFDNIPGMAKYGKLMGE